MHVDSRTTVTLPLRIIDNDGTPGELGIATSLLVSE